MTPIKSIRAKCLDCSGYQPKEIRNCPMTDCFLYPYRMGKNPNRKGLRPVCIPIRQKTSVEPLKSEKNGVLNEESKCISNAESLFGRLLPV